MSIKLVQTVELAFKENPKRLKKNKAKKLDTPAKNEIKCKIDIIGLFIENSIFFLTIKIP